MRGRQLLRPRCRLALAFVTLTLLMPVIASAAVAKTAPATIAAKRVFWYARIHNEYLGAAFGTKLVAHHAAITVPARGVVRFAQTNKLGTGRANGRITCVAQTKTHQTHFSCKWVITVTGRARYFGVSFVVLYKPPGFNVEPGWSKCKVLVSGSTFCRRYPAPTG